MNNDNSLNPQKTEMLILETPDEFKHFILKHNLLDGDNEVTLSIIIDNIITLVTVNISSTEYDSARLLFDVVFSTINELGLDYSDEELATELAGLFENTCKFMLSNLLANDCYNKYIYCYSVDIYKICLEVRDKDKPWQ